MSIKEQCAAPYFYGDDLLLEEAFQYPESVLSETVRRINSTGAASAEDLKFLILFWLLQRNRGVVTLSDLHLSFRTMREKMDDGSEATKEFLGEELGVPDIAKMVFLETQKGLEQIIDLKRCVVRSHPKEPFVISDNPAVMANRFLQLKLKRFLGAYGLGSSGVYFYLPLTPRLAFLAFDQNVYDIDVDSSGIVNLSTHDTQIFNYIQLINVGSCIYFQDWRLREKIKSALNPHVYEIPSSRFRVNIAADRGIESDGSRKFEVVDDDEFRSSPRTLIHLESRLPRPMKHPSIMRLKVRQRYVDTRTGAGILRPNSVQLDRFEDRQLFRWS